MVQTLSTDLYRPEVWADLAFVGFIGNAIVANAAVQDDTLTGQPGSTVNFPKWMALGELDDLTEGTAMVPAKLTQSSSQATIKEAGKAVEITDKASLTGIGNAQDEAIRQFGILAARKVDTDLIAVAQATVTGGITYADGTTATASAPLTHATTAGSGVAKLTYADIVAAAAKFGDEFDPADMAGLYINSATWASMIQDTAFISAAQMQGANQIVTRGQIGQILGVNVFVTDRLASGKALLLRRNAIGVMWKRRPLVEQDRDILARSTVVTTNLHYAVKRLNDKGVVNITLTA